MTRLSGKNKNIASKKSFLVLFPIVFILFLLNSCFKPGGQIGDVIQPEQSKLKIFYTDTASVYAFSIKEDSVRSDELTTTQFGSIADPTFGNTVASFYTQFTLSALSQDFGTNPVVDSMFLYLYYTGSFGDTNTTLKIRVFELLEGIHVDSVYYSNRNFEVGTDDYADYSFIPRPNDSLIIGNDTLPPALRVNLSANPSLGNKLLNATTDDLASNETFREFFKGLYVTSDPVNSGGSLLSFNLLSTFSRMIIYYKNDEEDSLYYNFLITSSSARVGRYQHDFSFGDQPFRQQVVDGDTSLGKQMFYIQGLGGVKSLIRFPHLSEFYKLGHVAVNEAKLILSGYENEPYNGAPAKVIILEALADGKYQLLEDNSGYGDYFGGLYKSSVNQYQFRITQYVQNHISNPDLPNYGLYLFVYGSSIYPQRFIFNGNEPVADTASRLRLELLYTDLE